MKTLFLLVLLAVVPSSVHAQTADGVFHYPNPFITPGLRPANESQTWTFRTQSDGGDARIVVDSQGIHTGASPWGVAELVLRAQDEIHDASGSVIHSADIKGHIRVMPFSYGYTATSDPEHINCFGTQCGAMMEFYSDYNIRFTAAGGGALDWVTNNHARLRLLSDGTLYYFTPTSSGYTPPAGVKLFACIAADGAVVGQSTPCDR